MGLFTDYPLTIDCLIHFFYIAEANPTGEGTVDQREFKPRLRAHTYTTNYDSLSVGQAFPPSTISHTGQSSLDDPRFSALIEVARTNDQLIEAVVSLSIRSGAATSRRFVIAPDTSVPFLVHAHGPSNDAVLAQTELALHGVFRGGHRLTLSDLAKNPVRFFRESKVRP